MARLEWRASISSQQVIIQMSSAHYTAQINSRLTALQALREDIGRVEADIRD